MSTISITFFAYIIDRVFGEFDFVTFYKHPVVFMGDYIKWFEKNYYKNSVFQGGLLVITLLAFVIFIVFIIDYFIDNILLLSIIASSGLASKSLYDSVHGVLQNPQTIKYLVSRDTKDLSNSDINKAAIETYAENLSDGVVAPLFYLLLFGLYGLFFYKAINTLDSMVGYRNEKYEKFGKISARVDDILNFIPARLTAIIILILFFKPYLIKQCFYFGKQHESINAGYPISAMALSLDISLGGDTSYFGKIKSKPFFGTGRKDIQKDDITKALSFQKRFDIFVLLFLTLLLV